LPPAVARLLLPLTVVALLALAACSGDENAPTPDETHEPAGSPTAPVAIETTVVATPTVRIEQPTPTALPEVPTRVPSPSPEPTETPTPAQTPAPVFEIELDPTSSSYVIEGSEIRLQFLELFEAERCPAQGKCSDLGGATALIGVSGEGTFPVIVELALGSPLYRVSGYDLLMTSIDRGEAGDSVAITVTSTGGGLSGGVLATFSVDGETFRVWVTNPLTAGRIVALGNGEITSGFPRGTLRPGPGETNHNQPHRWHFDPEATLLAKEGAEPCDALPSVIDGNREFWLDTLGTYCPRSAQLLDVQDLRAPTP
jgi:hypothetical protein